MVSLVLICYPASEIVPIGNTFGELDHFGSVSASHSCTQSNPFDATGWGALMRRHLIEEVKNHA